MSRPSLTRSPPLPASARGKSGLGYDGSGNLKVLLDTDDLEIHSGNIRHKKPTSGLEQIVIRQDGDKHLHARVKTNGVWSPEGTEPDMTVNDSGHVTEAWRD